MSDGPMLPDDELDRRLRERARAARDVTPVSESEIEQALASVMSGSPAVADREGRESRRPLIWVASAAAVLVLMAGIVAVRGARDDVASVPPVVTNGSTVPVATSTPSSIASTTTLDPTPSTTVASSTTTTTISPTSTSTTAPTTTTTLPAAPPPLTDEELIELLDGTAWEGSGIGRACDAAGTTCTQLAIGPGGEPITFDPLSDTLTRHARHDGEYVTISVPDALDPIGLLAVGPDEIAYLIVPAAIDESDVYAVSLASEDAGEVLGQFPGVIPLGDGDIMPAPAGLVSSGWYEPGPRPAADAEVLVEWIDRDPGDNRPTGVEYAWFDDLGRAAGVHGRGWSLDGRSVTSQQPGSSQVVATFDGGFVAVYSESTGDLRAEVIRGWPDGSVEYWQLPRSWTEIGSPTPEPMGTILLPAGERFIRIAPFADRTPDLGEVTIDFETGVVDVTEINATIVEQGLDDPVDGLGGEAIAAAIAGPLGSPAELRTIVSGPLDEGGVTITVTTERHLDDSVYGSRFDVTLAGDLYMLGPVESITWSQTCQPDRGHQDYRAEFCV